MFRVWWASPLIIVVDNKYVVTCQNAGKPGVRERAKLNIQKHQAEEEENEEQ